MRMLTLVVFVLLTTAGAAAAPQAAAPLVAAPLDDVAGMFLETLVADDMGVIARTTADGGLPGPSEELRETLDAYDCITVVRMDPVVVSATADHLHLLLDLHATGEKKADWRPVAPLPRWWHVEARPIDGAWKITRAMTEERRIAIDMAGASSAEAECMLAIAPAGLDVTRLTISYPYELEVFRKWDQLEHGVAMARAHANPFGEIIARRMQLLLFARHAKRPAEEVVAAGRAALAVAEASGDPDDLSEAWFTLATAHVVTGDLRTAMGPFRQSADLVSRAADPIRSIKSLHMISWIHQGHGELLASVRAAEQVRDLSRHYRWGEGEEVSAFTRADAHVDLQNYEIARDTFKDLMRSTLGSGNRQFAGMAAGNVGTIERMLGRHASAVQYYQQALELSGDAGHRGEIEVRLADTLVDAGAHADAEQVLRAIAARTSANTESKGVLSRVHRIRSRLHGARGDDAAALAEARIAVDMNRDPDTFFHLGKLLRRAGRRTEAIAVIREGVTMLEEKNVNFGDELVLANYFNVYRHGYVELVELLAEEGHTEEAFRTAEQMKGRSLRNVLARGHIDLSASMTGDERERENALEKKVIELNRAVVAAAGTSPPDDALRAQLAEARLALEAFRREMRLRHPALVTRRIEDGDPLKMPDAESLAVVEYVVGETQTIAFTLVRGRDGATSIRAHRLPVTREALEREVSRFGALIAGRSLSYHSSARRLYATLVRPLEEELAGRKSLCVIPDGTLWTVPFHALLRGDGDHLADRHAVFYAHSLVLLRNAQSTQVTAPARLIAFGNPTIGVSARATLRSLYRDTPLGSLEDAETEARSLSTMYAARSRAYVREEARETVFKDESPEFDIIHVAAHAVVDDAAPMYSAIVLAANRADATEDGLLEAREVVDLPLSAELAVLSACETARGKVGGGEGVVGLAWAFFAAGCPTTVVSQWKAESRATSILMIDFHRRLLAGATTAEALRGAQLALRKTPEYAHPFYWAPFVAIGAATRNPGAK